MIIFPYIVFVAQKDDFVTSLSSVSSPRANEPNSQAFKTGWVLKYSRMVSNISVLITAFKFSAKIKKYVCNN